MSNIKVEIEGSARHCHITRETQDILFGKGYELKQKKMLTQPGQFASEEKVTLVGSRASTQLTIIGPCRKADQIELSMTDTRAYGFSDVPIRESGDVKGSPGCKLVGPCGEVVVAEGVIIMKRHVHLSPEDAAKYGISDKQIVKLKITGERALIYDEVVARTGPEHATYVHLDIDEYNAAGISSENSFAEVISD